jgi:hypothetical protein
MSIHAQIVQYALIRVRGSQVEDCGEVSATTVIWAAALIAVAVLVSVALVGKIQSKADGISL